MVCTAGPIVLDHAGQSRAGHTMLDHAPNGVDVVNIARPNANGVSHNTYIKFNVPTQGVILNNAKRETKTKLAGYIYGNENVKNGQATLILNEVTGTNRTQMNGYLEVAGKAADVIVANPNGISVNGGGFINIPKATLTTGKVYMEAGRPTFEVRQGDIDISGKGLDASTTDKLALYTKALKLNAKLHAKDLDVVTGVNRIDANGAVTVLEEEKSSGVFSIDSTVLGGIYADAIRLTGTQKGVGVNLPGEILAQDRLQLSSDGRIVIGKAVTGRSVKVESRNGSLEIEGGVHGGDVLLSAAKEVRNNGNIGAKRRVSVSAEQITNNGIVASGVDESFTVNGSGTTELKAGKLLENSGTLFASHTMDIDAEQMVNDGAVASRGSMRLSGETLLNRQTLYAKETMSLQLQGLLQNFSEIYSGGDMSIGSEVQPVGRLENSTGSIVSEGAMSMVASEILNEGETQIDYDVFYQNLITGRLMSSAEKERWIRYRAGYRVFGDENFSGVNRQLRAYGLLGKVVEVYGSAPHREGSSGIGDDDESHAVAWTEFKTIVADRSTTVPALISSGKTMSVKAEYLRNQDATMAAVENLYLDVDTVDNTSTGEEVNLYRTVNTVAWYFIDNDWDTDDDTALGIYYREVNAGRQHIGGTSKILAGGTIVGTGNILNNGSSSGSIIDTSLASLGNGGVQGGGRDDFEITLPQESNGIFVVNADPKGPLIETNPLYTDYNNFVSSEYMLTRLGYDAMGQTRRLGDALYETQLIRDAVMAQTGRRFIVDTDSDNVQYAILMKNGVRYAKKHGLKVGEHLDDEARENLDEDMVWLEERTVEGQKVLVPVLYLASNRKMDAGGALIAAQTVALSLEGMLQNSGSVTAEHGVYIAVDRMVNEHGTIASGGMIDVNARGDIENLSGTIQGRDVMLRSRKGSIVNRTLHRDAGSDAYAFTVVDIPASITAQNGLLLMEAAKDIEVTAASIEGKTAAVLQAGGDILVESIERREDFSISYENGYTRRKRRTYATGSVRSKGVLQLEAGNDIHLEAADLKAERAVLSAKNRIDIAAVVESDYRLEHNENSDLLGSNSATDMQLRQRVFGTSIDASTIYIDGIKGVSLESVTLSAGEGMLIRSEDGRVDFGTKAYTNASLKQRESSLLGGLFEEHSLNEQSQTLLAGTTAEAQNHIIVNGKNIDMEAARLSVQNGLLLLEAKENIYIRSGLERSESRTEEAKRGLSFGMDGGKITFAKEERSQKEMLQIHNESSVLNASGVLLKSGKDTTVAVSHIVAENVKVEADGNFNLLAGKDVTRYSAARSKKEIGIEFTLNSREASLFAGYWEEAAGARVTRSDVASATLQAKNVNIDAQNTNIVGSKVSADTVAISSENIRILSESAWQKRESYSRSVRAGVEVGVRQHLSDVIDAVSAVGKAKDATAKASRTLQAYDALASFAQHPVSVSVAAVYESSGTSNLGESTASVASSIVAENALVLSAVHTLEVGGSDIHSFGKLEIDAGNMNLYAGKDTYRQLSQNDGERTSTRLYASGFGETTASYMQNDLLTEGVRYRNSRVRAGDAAITVSDDITLQGANIDAGRLALYVGGDLKIESLQDRQRISGSSVGATTTAGLSMPTLVSGVSLNIGKTRGERQWVEMQSGINAKERVEIDVAGKTSLKGAYITNMDENGKDGGNLVFNTGTLSVSDIYDVDTYSSTMAGAGVGSIDRKPGISTLSYGSETRNSEQVNRATVGHGTIAAAHVTGTLNRDVNKRQERTKEESSSTELYISDRTLQLATAPKQSIVRLNQNLKDVGLAAHVEIVENLPSKKYGSVDRDGNPLREDGVRKNGLEIALDNSVGVVLDKVSSLGLLPSVENSGGYVSQLAIQLFGDNRAGLTLKTKEDMQMLGLTKERKPGDTVSDWEYEKVTLAKTEDGIKPLDEVENPEDIKGTITAYRTNPDKQLVIEDGKADRSGNPELEAYKIRVSADAIRKIDVGHLFTNGMFNTPDTALYNQQTQQGFADSVLNYNQMHGIVGDLIEDLQDHITVNGLDMLAEVVTLGQADGAVDGLGFLGTGSARQTGELIRQMMEIRNGDLVVGAHSQGTMMTQNGMDLYRDELKKIVQENPDSKFQVQYSGAPVNHVIAENLMLDIYGGVDGIGEHFNKDGVSIDDVFRSNVTPNDFVGSVLGYQGAGINNSEKIGEAMMAGIVSVPRLFGAGDSSPHSYYPCVIGCGDERVTPEIYKYYTPERYDSEGNPQQPLENYYRENFEVTRSNGAKTMTIQTDLLPSSKLSDKEEAYSVNLNSLKKENN